VVRSSSGSSTSSGVSKLSSRLPLLGVPILAFWIAIFLMQSNELSTSNNDDNGKDNKSSFSLSSFIFFSLETSAAWIRHQVIVRDVNHNVYHKVLTWSVIIFFVLLGWFLLFGTPFKPPEERVQEESVTISPLGVQLSSSSLSSTPRINNESHRNKPAKSISKRSKSIPIFIPRSDIIDVIVSEVILSYKVTSVVHFRIVKNTNLTSLPAMLSETSSPSTTTMNALLKVDHISLIPAFPNVEMTYKECQHMWYEISKALGKLE